MADQILTGGDFPTIELQGATFTLRFTRGGLLYRLSKSGTNIADMRAGGTKSFSAVVEVLHAALYGQFSGTPDQLADIVMDGGQEKIREARIAIDLALGKVFPSTLATAATGEAKESPKPQLQ